MFLAGDHANTLCFPQGEHVQGLVGLMDRWTTRQHVEPGSPPA
jgi:hypothetical protein